MGAAGVKRLIVTADDFGNSIPINEAVERGHREGILSAASLMVGGPAFEDAVTRARGLPGLGVGLHLTLVDGRPVLPPEEVAGLVGTDGRFHTDAVKQGVALFFSPRLRRQARAEIRAQFARFHATGLALDHVNGHQHFHMHPVVVSELFSLLPDYGRPPVRRPVEPFEESYRATGDQGTTRLLNSLFYSSQAWWLKRRMAALGIHQNDAVFGINDTGKMTAERVVRYLEAIPEGTTELYLHPATRRWAGPDNLPDHYRSVEEFAALLDENVRAAVERLALAPMPFAEAFASHLQPHA